MFRIRTSQCILYEKRSTHYSIRICSFSPYRALTFFRGPLNRNLIDPITRPQDGSATGNLFAFPTLHPADLQYIIPACRSLADEIAFPGKSRFSPRFCF